MKNLHTYIGDKLCESKTTHDWSEYAAKGLAMTSIGHYEKAIQCFKKGLELQPREYSLWDNLGHALMMQRRHVEACKCFRKSIALNPTSAIAWINLGNVMGREGKYNKALEYYERALDYEPDNEHAKFGSNQAHQLLYESKTRNQERNQQSPP